MQFSPACVSHLVAVPMLTCVIHLVHARGMEEKRSKAPLHLLRG